MLAHFRQLGLEISSRDGLGEYFESRVLLAGKWKVIVARAASIVVVDGKVIILVIDLHCSELPSLFLGSILMVDEPDRLLVLFATRVLMVFAPKMILASIFKLHLAFAFMHRSFFGSNFLLLLILLLSVEVSIDFVLQPAHDEHPVEALHMLLHDAMVHLRVLDLACEVVLRWPVLDHVLLLVVVHRDCYLNLA